ncbi:MAG: hypothetical protein MK135_00035 [Polyangiaceae bacterium]|nr:hypothetical protein [Polyangiaceae bacterium]
MISRRAIFLGLAVAVISSSALAGSYLARASLFIGGAEKEVSVLRRRFHDKELARALHRLAEARVKAAREMEIPPEVSRPHPHFLLALECWERATDAASRGQHEDFLVALEKARREVQTFEALLRKSGWHLDR